MPIPRAAATMSIPGDPASPGPPSLPSRYRVDELLGEGAQGAVYAGVDTLTDTPIAVKLLPSADPNALARVAREVSALRLLGIPGVVRLLESGGDSHGSWIVMERLAGTPFPAGRTTWEALRPLLVSLLETLARVHDTGLLHRDIKPGNVIVDAAGCPVLLDFGLVRGTAAGPTITRTGAVMGTPLYMAPEQVRGDRADRRTDLYALGAMTREALTGEVPFHSTQIGLLFEARLRADPPTILSALPDLPRDAAALLDALVARRPEARPTSARAALAMLSGEPTPDLLPWFGPVEPIVALVEAARRGERAGVSGPRGSGRTRALREVAALLAADGTNPRWVGPSDQPLGSLRGVLGDPAPDDADPLATMRARLERRTHPDHPEVFLADDWEGVDPWTRSLLVRSRQAVLVATLPSAAAAVRSLPPVSDSEPPIPTVGTHGPVTLDELSALFAGPERLLHLPSDGGALLHRRTGGLATRVVSEVQRWVDAGLAHILPGTRRVKVTRAALDRITGGFAGPPVADVLEGGLPAELDELLAWVHLASPGCTVARLAAARREPAWRVELAVRQLEALGAVVRHARGGARAGEAAPSALIEPTRPAEALAAWQADVRLAAHDALARSLPPGEPGRMVHLVAIGDAQGAVEDAVVLARALADDGRLPEALAALREAAQLALSADLQVPDLWKWLASLAMQDGTRPVLAAAAGLLARAGADPVLVDVLQRAGGGPAAGAGSAGGGSEARRADGEPGGGERAGGEQDRRRADGAPGGGERAGTEPGNPEGAAGREAATGVKRESGEPGGGERPGDERAAEGPVAGDERAFGARSTGLEAAHPDPEIERLRWDVRVQAARGQGGPAYAATVAAAAEWAVAVGTEDALAARANWVSSWLYQEGRIAEAGEEAERGAGVRQALGGRMQLVVRASFCRMLLQETDRALALVGELLAVARARRLPRVEAQAEWVRRLIENQRRAEVDVDEELVAAVGELGAPELAGLIWVNEAVIAWLAAGRAQRAAEGQPAGARTGVLASCGAPSARGAELARQAQGALQAAGVDAAALWAEAVAIACAPDAEAAARCARRAVASGRADVALEVLGILRLTGGLLGEWSAELHDAVARTRPVGYDSARRGALAPAEVIEVFQLTAPEGAEERR